MDIARCSLFELKVPFNTNQPTSYADYIIVCIDCNIVNI